MAPEASTRGQGVGTGWGQSEGAAGVLGQVTGMASLSPEPHYYQLFCYIYQARNLVSNQILTFQGRWQAALSPAEDKASGRRAGSCSCSSQGSPACSPSQGPCLSAPHQLQALSLGPGVSCSAV